MQHWTIRFVENLQAWMRTNDCSIATALSVQTAGMGVPELLKCRDAALDLARVLELEIMFRGE